MDEMLRVLRGGGVGFPGRPQLGQEGSGDGDQLPSPQPQTPVAMTTGPPFRVFVGNLHFNGDVIRI